MRGRVVARNAQLPAVVALRVPRWPGPRRADDAQAWRRDTLRRLFETLEREQDMLHVLQDIAPSDDVRVTIGDEHPTTGEWGASIVAAPFKAGEATVGTIGIVGPTRMDYLSAMTAVRAVADRLTEASGDAER